MLYPLNESNTGSFQELAHSNDVMFGQLSLLTINPGCVRGGHYHKRKQEWFCAIHGSCLMELQNVKDYSRRNIVLGEFKKEFTLMLPYDSHRVRNLSDSEVCELLVIASEEYDERDPDTFNFGLVEYE